MICPQPDQQALSCQWSKNCLAYKSRSCWFFHVWLTVGGMKLDDGVMRSSWATSGIMGSPEAATRRRTMFHSVSWIHDDNITLWTGVKYRTNFPPHHQQSRNLASIGGRLWREGLATPLHGVQLFVVCQQHVWELVELGDAASPSDTIQHPINLFSGRKLLFPSINSTYKFVAINVCKTTRSLCQCITWFLPFERNYIRILIPWLWGHVDRHEQFKVMWWLTHWSQNASHCLLAEECVRQAAIWYSSRRRPQTI